MAINSTLQEYNQFLNANPHIKDLDPHNLPHDLTISTMTLTCKLPVKFNVIMIAKYLELSSTFIQTIKCGNNNEICRTLVPFKHKNKNKKIKIKQNAKAKPTTKKNFYNQVTIVINCSGMIKINVKLFKNGSIQITGCKNISSVIWILEKLFKKLQEFVPKNDNANATDNTDDTDDTVDTDKTPERYAEPYIFLKILDITDLKIAMINSNFDIGFNIDREKLFNLLIADKYECGYDPSRHAGVNIRFKSEHNISETDIHSSSIFVFDKGSIIITGARNYMQIMECYKFINMYLINNYQKIVRISIT